MPELKVTHIAVSKLKTSEYNPRKLSSRAEADLTESIKRFGLVDPIIINVAPNREHIVIGGHQRLLIAKKLEYKTVPVVELNIPDIDKEKELNLRLNKNTGEFDLELLRNFDLGLLLDVGFTDKELSSIWDDALSAEDDNFDVEKAKIEHLEPKTKPGDFFKLGNHFLLCGDATKLEDVRRLVGSHRMDMVYCDSPYNIALDYNKGMSTSGKYGATKTQDKKSEIDFRQFLHAAMQGALQVTKENAHFFYYCDENWIWLVQQLYQELGIQHQRVCLWIKNNANMVPQVAFNKVYEPVVYGVKGKPYLAKHVTNLNEVLNKEVGTGNRLSDDILDLFTIWLQKRKAGQDYLHPTEKPVSLHEKPLRRCTRPGDCVLDTFGGSGSTLIACDQMKRRAFLLEIDPVFCDVILERWKQDFGGEVQHVN